MIDDNKIEIVCSHGTGITSVICEHLVNSSSPIGFIENSSDPNDLQGWCFACEDMFNEEGEMTDRFRKFSQAKLVCQSCFAEIKVKNSIG